MAVYTDVPDQALNRFLETFNIGTALSFKGIAEGVENSNFLLKTTQGSYILTLYEKRVAEADLPFFIDLMEHLADKGLDCPRPIKNREGVALGQLQGRPAAIVTFLDGMAIQTPSVDQCHALGAALARLHLATADFSGRRPNALGQPSWRALYEQSKGRASSVQPGLEATIEQELAHLDKAWPTDLPSGVIHADLFTDNVFFKGPELSGFIDFYFACNDAYAYDIAVCLNDWCFATHEEMDSAKAAALMLGYRSQRPLSAVELAALPTLLRGSAMRFLLTRLYDYLSVPPGALVTPKDPLEYASKLRFHQTHPATVFGASPEKVAFPS